MASHRKNETREAYLLRHREEAKKKYNNNPRKSHDRQREWMINHPQYQLWESAKGRAKKAGPPTRPDGG